MHRTGKAGRLSRCQTFDSAHYRIRIHSVMAIQIGNRAGLAEMLDTKTMDAMPTDTAKPGKSGRMAIDNSNNSALARQWR